MKRARLHGVKGLEHKIDDYIAPFPYKVGYNPPYYLYL